ncbi:MAG: PEP-CTERM system histidine kinase PrsK, partial [Pseudomonadota bacterium]|nr:PEP-CTERM system histidine kinase PrsK [Pseudomonadota bacterium]
RAKLRVTVSKHFFPYRYDYREEWLRFTQALSLRDQHINTGQQVIRGLANLVESPAGALWLRDADESKFVPSAAWNMQPGEAEAFDGSLARFLRSTGWVVNLEEFRSSPHRYGALRLPDWLSASPNAWLVVPLAIGNELTGFVVLTTARTVIDVDWEVNDLLKTAGRQAASFLGHIEASEALLEARKFEAFNRLSAFVVHDLKNIVAQLSLMLSNAERHHANPEFRRDMLMTVGHSVDRMKQLMMQLREGTTPLDVAHRVDLAEVAERVRHAKLGQRPPVEVEIDERVATRAHADRLERVLGHLAQNAIEASDGSGRVWIKVGRQGPDALVEVGDTGHGMTSEFLRERLFKPFQTTKQSGMGIGAYESHQYVRELGGRVQVDSTPNVGTRVHLLLPLFESTHMEAPVKDVA